MSTGIYNLSNPIGFRGRPVRCGAHVAPHPRSVRSAWRARSECVGRTTKPRPRALSPPKPRITATAATPAIATPASLASQAHVA